MVNRIIGFDFLRALCMLYIVAFWHVGNYVGNLLLCAPTQILMFCALGAFVFMSGFLLAQKYAAGDIWKFWKKRVLRIYPLYAFALVLFFSIGLISSRLYFLAALFLLNAPLNIPITTLWFISMIFAFYLLMPVVWKLPVITLILFIFVCIILRSRIDEDLIIYFPCFVCGVISGKNKNLRIVIPKYLSLIVPKSASMLTIILKISNASFCMYLFHRVVYWGLLKLYTPHSKVLIVIYLLALGVPLTYYLSATTQEYYDRHLEKPIQQSN